MKALPLRLSTSQGRSAQDDDDDDDSSSAEDEVSIIHNIVSVGYVAHHALRMIPCHLIKTQSGQESGVCMWPPIHLPGEGSAGNHLAI